MTREECLRKCKEAEQADTEQDKKTATIPVLKIGPFALISSFDDAVFAREQARTEEIYQNCIKGCPEEKKEEKK
jgi:hypothetical protein